MEEFPNKCLIPIKDRELFAKIARQRGKSFYELCVRKRNCSVANICQMKKKDLLASPYEDIKSGIPILSSY